MLKGGRRTVNGCVKALNCAASTMYATSSPITNANFSDANDSWKAWLLPEGMARYPSGRILRAMSRAEAMASACEAPGVTLAKIVIARSRSLRVMACRVGVCSMRTMSPRWMSCPLPVRTSAPVASDPGRCQLTTHRQSFPGPMSSTREPPLSHLAVVCSCASVTAGRCSWPVCVR